MFLPYVSLPAPRSVLQKWNIFNDNALWKEHVYKNDVAFLLLLTSKYNGSVRIFTTAKRLLFI